jgi:hypothetical protein
VGGPPRGGRGISSAKSSARQSQQPPDGRLRPMNVEHVPRIGDGHGRHNTWGWAPAGRLGQARDRSVRSAARGQASSVHAQAQQGRGRHGPPDDTNTPPRRPAASPSAAALLPLPRRLGLLKLLHLRHEVALELHARQEGNNGTQDQVARAAGGFLARTQRGGRTEARWWRAHRARRPPRHAGRACAAVSLAFAASVPTCWSSTLLPSLPAVMGWGL